MAEPEAEAAEEHLVHEAVGPDFHPLEAAGALAVGVNGLLVIGVMPALLGTMAEAGRLSEAGIGHAATLELLAMGITTALAGMALKPARLKLMGAVLALILAALDVGSMSTAGAAFLALRTAAGAVEGVLLWLTVSMIARTVTPERWAGVFFTAQTGAQLALAIAFALMIMPRFGIEGGFASLAIISVISVIPALFAPSAYAPLPTPPGESGVPPFRGWVALIGTFVYVSAAGAVGVYLQPLALEAHLSADVARTALWVGLAAQVAGGMSATAMAGRIGWFNVFLITTAGYLISWWVMGRSSPAALFIGANVLAGYVGLLLGPFLVPMTIEADPSRRAAVQSGGAQVLGGALGPYLASFVVNDADVRGVLWLGVAALGLGLLIVGWLHLTARRGARLSTN